MSKILIIGATTQALRNLPDTQLVLFARHATQRLRSDDKQAVIDGDALRLADLKHAMSGIDAVFVTVSGPVDKIAQQVIYAMQREQITKLVAINSVGIYNEVPATIPTDNLDDSTILPAYRRAADIIETSDLNYTILRPGWFTNGTVNYETTQKGEQFGGMYVSVASIADAAKRALTSDYGHCESIGLNTPEH